MKWPADIDWESPAGQILTILGNTIPAERRTPILLFGSGALQITVAPTVLSEDADIAPDIIPCDPRTSKFPNAYDRPGLMALVRENGLGIGQRKLYLQVNASEAFDPGTGYARRVMTVDRGNLQITIPHPLDILIAKLHRFEEKDIDAWRKVFATTGFPTPEIVLDELRRSPRLFAKRDHSHGEMPKQFPESKIADSVPKLFRELWGRSISVNRDILRPTDEALTASYNDHKTGHTSRLGDIASQPLSGSEEKFEQKEEPDQGSSTAEALALLKKRSLLKKR